MRDAGPVTARMSLREATRAEHAAVDAVYSAFDLSTLSGYGRFLRAQSSCVASLEAALAEPAQALLGDWPARIRAPLLAADLADMGLAVAPPITAPDLPDDAAVLGAVYVLEGSRFGGAVLARRLAPDAPARFLMAPTEPNSWRSFMSSLDRHLVRSPDFASAIGASRAVFHSFEAAGREELGLPRVDYV